MIPWWIFASLLANVSLISVEYFYRSQADFAAAMSRAWPLIVLGQVGLYFAWHNAPHLLVAWAIFSIGNSLIRLAMVTFILGEPTKIPWALAGISLMFVGGYVVKMGTMR